MKIKILNVSRQPVNKVQKLNKQYDNVNSVLNKKLKIAKKQNCFVQPLTKECRHLILEIDELTELSQKLEEQLCVMESYNNYCYDKELEERFYDI